MSGAGVLNPMLRTRGAGTTTADEQEIVLATELDETTGGRVTDHADATADTPTSEQEDGR